MNKKEWYTLIIGVLILPILFDQFTKWIALSLLSDSAVTLGPIGFGIYKDALIISGQLNIAQYVKIISSFGFSIFFLFFIFCIESHVNSEGNGF